MILSLMAGDHIKADRGLYCRHGIYLGSGMVATFVRHQGVVELPVEDFVEGGDVYLAIHDNIATTRSQIFARAQACLEGGVGIPEFDNDEGFTNWCVNRSEQYYRYRDVPLSTLVRVRDQSKLRQLNELTTAYGGAQSAAATAPASTCECTAQSQTQAKVQGQPQSQSQPQTHDTQASHAPKAAPKFTLGEDAEETIDQLKSKLGKVITSIIIPGIGAALGVAAQAALAEEELDRTRASDAKSSDADTAKSGEAAEATEANETTEPASSSKEESVPDAKAASDATAESAKAEGSTSTQADSAAKTDSAAETKADADAGVEVEVEAEVISNPDKDDDAIVGGPTVDTEAIERALNKAQHAIDSIFSNVLDAADNPFDTLRKKT